MIDCSLHKAFAERQGDTVVYRDVNGRWRITGPGWTRVMSGTYEAAAEKLIEYWIAGSERDEIHLSYGDELVAMWQCPFSLTCPDEPTAQARVAKMFEQASDVIASPPGVSLPAWFAARFAHAVIPFIQTGCGALSLLQLTQRLLVSSDHGPHLRRWLTVYCGSIDAIRHAAGVHV